MKGDLIESYTILKYHNAVVCFSSWGNLEFGTVVSGEDEGDVLYLCILEIFYHRGQRAKSLNIFKTETDSFFGLEVTGIRQEGVEGKDEITDRIDR